MAAKAAKPLPVGLVLRRLVDPATGNPVGAFVPATEADRSLLSERAFRVGARLRATLSEPRNSRFNALVHGLGKLLGQNLERFAGMPSHDVIKALQLEAEVYCDRVEYDVPGLGRLIRIEPQSLGFDSMDDATFSDFWRRCVAYLLAHDWPTLTAAQVEEMAELAADGGRG